MTEFSHRPPGSPPGIRLRPGQLFFTNRRSREKIVGAGFGFKEMCWMLPSIMPTMKLPLLRSIGSRNFRSVTVNDF